MAQHASGVLEENQRYRNIETAKNNPPRHLGSGTLETAVEIQVTSNLLFVESDKRRPLRFGAIGWPVQLHSEQHSLKVSTTVRLSCSTFGQGQ